eukprot:CAMPEP_0182424134 /NCGR_PEP_ID=MMETSP1167-20130531/10289_1 /TAXON_ID=2988 /ORGANISM="Mallomonas Sp, Strain CCMP3275" /LENGTH=340 /DNA_ID=CAMNT_0024603697 /DNA_START=362 /DNA_END=1381 /DNA_ORIENTATION=-
MQPSPELLSRIKERRNRMKGLEAAVHRWEWRRAEEERKKREAMAADAERSAYQSIDWYDFTVVETITFGEEELLELPGLRLAGTVTDEMDMDTDAEMPPPPPPKPVVKPTSLPVPQPSHTSSSTANKPTDINMNGSRSSQMSSTQAMGMPPPPPARQVPAPPPPSAPAPAPPDEDEDMDTDIKVVHDYRPRVQLGGRSAPMTMIDPLSGKAIPASEMSEHMRIQLMDPRWREEQKRFQEKQVGTGYAAGSSIASNLQIFAKQRGDIFGSSEEEEAMLLEEREGVRRRAEDANKIIWDGYHSTAASTQMAKNEQAAKQPAPPPVTTASSIGPSASTVHAPK